MKSVGIAVAFLYNKDKKVLMQHRSNDDDRYPGYWGCFGGHMDEGETPEETLRRELLEELEYKINTPKLLVAQELIDGDKKITSRTFMEEYDESQPLVQHEGQGLGWFTIEEALELKITDLRREALLKAKNYLDNL
jgi:8-oxo-dGTP diphosphatase